MKMCYFKGNPDGGLTPITSLWMHALFDNQKLLRQLMARYGSPVNVLHLPTFTKNIESFKKVFESRKLDHQIYYARKANKCKGLVSRAFTSGIGVDTASFNELRQSLELGGTGENLVLTSAIKTRDQLKMAIKHKVPIILDNSDECRLVNATAIDMGVRAQVGFRVSGFHYNGSKRYSRFGFDVDDISDFICRYLGTGKDFDHLDVKGLHFHLDGYSIPQRGEAVLACLRLAEDLKGEDFMIQFIDMGGGILMNYLEDGKQWIDFDRKLRSSVQKNTSAITFNKNGLGYRMAYGKLTGKLETYPFYNKIHSDKFLNKILDYPNAMSGMTVAQRLSKLAIEIRIEPGRSLLDQVGITIARVVHRKQDMYGQWLVGLEMNMSQMMSSSADYLLDPFVLYSNYNDGDSPVEVYFTGAYCLERDILLKRQIKLPKLPDIGDLIVFVNTAGYMMHFFETEAHLFKLSTNLTLAKDTISKVALNDFVEDNSITQTNSKTIA